MSKKVVLAGACRTAIGKMGGALSTTPAPKLGSIVIEEALKRAGVPKDAVDHVYMGCVIQAGLGQNVARQASIGAGLPIETTAVTVNVVCGSGLNCVNMAAQMIQTGDADIVVAGGMENMSMAPYAAMNARFGYRMNNGKLVDTMVNDALWDAFNQYHMMITAENVAEKYGITREELDEFSANSQQKCEAAIAAGKFKDEIVPVEVKSKKKTIVFDTDEGPRPGTTAESLSGLRCCSGKEGGVVTAGNASGINDGAAAIVVMSEEKAKELGVTVDFMSPNTKDDAQQIECVNNAVAGGYDAIMVAANGPDAISSALQEAKDQGIKIVYVDSPANVEAEATFSTDNEAAGTTAGEEMKKALEDAGITSGKIGIINVNAATDSCVNREEGFRAAFDGTDFEIMETQYGEGDAAKSQSIAENYITQGVVGIFGCNEGSTTGAGNAIKAAGNADIIGVGFDKSDAILNLIDDGYLLCTMAQNPDVMGSEGVKAAVKAINGEELGGEVTDTGVSVITKDSDK